jgi:hypothetical protein
VLSQLPKQLAAALPTPTELARECSRMALVKPRIDIERMLRQLTRQHGVPDGPSSVRSMLERLAQARGLPQSAAAFAETLRVLNPCFAVKFLLLSVARHVTQRAQAVGIECDRVCLRDFKPDTETRNNAGQVTSLLLRRRDVPRR